MANPKNIDKFDADLEYKRLYKIYAADRKILAFHFRILIAFEKWPPDRRVNENGNIFKHECNQLTDELKLINSQLTAYLSANYALLEL